MLYLFWLASGALLLVSMLLLVRNNIIFTIRSKRIKYVFSSAEDWRIRLKHFDQLSYDQMLFDLRKWTYKHFYGDDE